MQQIVPNIVSSQDLTVLMQNSLATFFKDHLVQEVLPDNAKVI